MYPSTALQLRITRVISAIFLRDTLEAASNDAEMLVQEMPDLVQDFGVLLLTVIVELHPKSVQKPYSGY